MGLTTCAAFFIMEITIDHPSKEQPVVGERFYAYYAAPRVRANKRAGEENAGTFTFVISNSGEDRHESVVEATGLDVREYMKNPIVLFNHDPDKIIGRAISLELKGDSWIAQVEFDRGNDFAEEKRGQVERGFLKGASIGFIVKEWSFDEENDTFVIKSAELVEFSIVAIPSNRDALKIENNLKEEIASLKRELAALKEPVAAEGREDESAEGAGNDPAHIEATGVQEDEGADSDQEEAPAEEENSDATLSDQDNESSLEDDNTSEVQPRAARIEDYEALIEKMVPRIRSNVRRRLGKE